MTGRRWEGVEMTAIPTLLVSTALVPVAYTIVLVVVVVVLALTRYCVRVYSSIAYGLFLLSKNYSSQ